MTNPAPPTIDLIALFTERLSAVGGHARNVAGSVDAAGAIHEIANGAASNTIWISDDIEHLTPSLVAQLGELGYQTRVPANPAEVRDQPLGLAVARGAIAETGSSILVEPHLNSRSVTLMTETLIVVCPTAALVPSLAEAAGVLREISYDGASYATFITGPSRTADIERQLTVGVQGPGVFHVLLVDDLT